VIRLWQENVKVVQLADEHRGAGPTKVKDVGEHTIPTSLSHNYLKSTLEKVDGPRHEIETRNTSELSFFGINFS